MLIKPKVKAWFDTVSHTMSYVVYQAPGKACAIIDPVLGYSPTSRQVDTRLADEIIHFVDENNLNVAWLLETHHHADHVTAASYIKTQRGGCIAMNHHINAVASLFPPVFDLVDEADINSYPAFDYLFADNEVFSVGELTAQALYVPGHTLTCVAYLIGDAVFVGDTLFMPDVGTGRCDFPGGDAAVLYRSIQKIFALPLQTRVFVCHDYPPPDRQPACETTIAEQRTQNVHIQANTALTHFVEMRTRRDKGLTPPQLMQPAIQLNLRAGKILC